MTTPLPTPNYSEPIAHTTSGSPICPKGQSASNGPDGGTACLEAQWREILRGASRVRSRMLLPRLVAAGIPPHQLLAPRSLLPLRAKAVLWLAGLLRRGWQRLSARVRKAHPRYSLARHLNFEIREALWAVPDKWNAASPAARPKSLDASATPTSAAEN